LTDERRYLIFLLQYLVSEWASVRMKTLNCLRVFADFLLKATPAPDRYPERPSLGKQLFFEQPRFLLYFRVVRRGRNENKFIERRTKLFRLLYLSSEFRPRNAAPIVSVFSFALYAD
jgi:hypothetical protein